MIDRRAASGSPAAGAGDRIAATAAVDRAPLDGSVQPTDAVVDLATHRLASGRVSLRATTEWADQREIDPPLHLASRVPVQPPSSLGLAVKRGVDVAGAVAILIVLGPLLLATAALIALLDGRPVLFRQMRAGRDERPFEIFKFRTMRVGADAERMQLRSHNEVNGGASFKMTNDPRVTGIGRLLRRTSLDEFPQLLNVLAGDMSLVGPRPHPFDDLEGYKPWHHARTMMKPGMTGLWQVSSRSDPDFDHWVELDLEYIRRWSPWLDMQIIMRTIPAMLRAEGR